MTMLESIRKSVATNSMIRRRNQSLDMYSASAILAVYNALSDDNKKKFEEVIERNVLKAASIAFKLCK